MLEMIKTRCRVRLFDTINEHEVMSLFGTIDKLGQRPGDYKQQNNFLKLRKKYFRYINKKNPPENNCESNENNATSQAFGGSKKNKTLNNKKKKRKNRRTKKR
jgi:hypothetical protein